MADTRACALEGLTPCGGPISREHYISRAVLDVIAPDGKITIEGTPWAQQAKSVPIQSLAANILCRTHNSQLSDLDAEGGRFAAFIRQAQLDLARPNPIGGVAGFEGRKLERWFLKVLFGMWVSGNVAVDGAKVASSPGAHLGPLLLGAKPMPSKWGLYVKAPQSAFATSHSEFEVVTRSAPDHEIKAADFRLCRLPFTIILGIPSGDWGVRRPRSLSLKNERASHRARIDWGAYRAGAPTVYDRIGDAV